MKTKSNLIVLLSMVLLFAVMLYKTGAINGGTKYMENRKATVISVEKIDKIDEYGHHPGQNVQVKITSGPESGQIIQIFNGLSSNPRDLELVLSPGDKIIVGIDNYTGEARFYISDFDRTSYFMVLVAVFIVGLLFFGQMIGLKSLVAIGVSMLVLWQWLSYTLLPNANIFMLALQFCAVISLFVLLLVGGFTHKTLAALLGTWGGLFFAGLLSLFAIRFMHLTGIDTEEAMTLKATMYYLDFHGVLFASIIIGALGAIIDVTISIASAQYELYQANTGMTWKQLYLSGMNVGKDVMGAMSNTLILAYVGSSLPFLLLIAAEQQAPLEGIINIPIIMSELVRAVIGSIGLIYAIPLTAFIMAVMVCNDKSSEK